MSDFTPPPPPSYGSAAPTPGGVPPNHPKAMTSLILGILGLVCCGPLGIVAFFMGRKTEAEIIASNGQLGGQQLAKVGWILGAIAGVLFVLGVLLWIVLLATGAMTADIDTSTTGY